MSYDMGPGKFLVVAGTVVAGVACGVGYGVCSYFNSAALDEKNKQLQELTQKEQKFKQFLTPEEQKSYDALKEKANARYVDYVAKQQKKPF